jgi:hypothetical protein
MPATTDESLTALRTTIATLIAEATQDFPDHHGMLDRIAGTLHLNVGNFIEPVVRNSASNVSACCKTCSIPLRKSPGGRASASARSRATSSTNCCSRGVGLLHTG